MTLHQNATQNSFARIALFKATSIGRGTPPPSPGTVAVSVMQGCPHNKCTFCGLFRGQKTAALPLSLILDAIRASVEEQTLRHEATPHSLFLLGADSLSLPAKHLAGILNAAKELLPSVTHITCCATVSALLGKSKRELKRFRRAGLTRVYVGMESGNEQLLRRSLKGHSRSDLLRAAEMLAEAEITQDVAVLLGLGGPDLAVPHAVDTGTLISKTEPECVHLYTLVPVTGTPLGQEYAAGRFHLSEPGDIFKELVLLIRHITGSTTLLSEHWTNFLNFSATLPVDKERILASLSQALRQPRGVFRPTGISSVAV